MTNEELKELLQAQTTVLKAEMKATTDLLGYKIDEVIGHQKVTNGRVTKLEEDCTKYDKHLDDTGRLWKNRKLIGFVAGFVLIFSSLTATWLYHNVNLEKTLEEVLSNKGIIIHEKVND